MEAKNYEAIVISGGGSNGILSLGALHYEFQKGTYDPAYVRIYAGTSIGSVISLLLICGYTPMEIFAEVYTTDHFFDINKFGSIWDIFKYMGLISINVFSNKIDALVKRKFGYTPTMLELYNLTQKVLVTVVTNVTKMKCEYYTYKNKPDTTCVDAVMHSCNLPLIFHSIHYSDSYIVDGGLTDNFPLRYIDDRKIKILGIVTMGIDFSLTDTKFTGYFYRLVVMPVNANTELRCALAKPNTKLIKIVRNKSSLKLFSISSDVKMSMFWDGYSVAQKVDNTFFIHVKGYEILDTML